MTTAVIAGVLAHSLWALLRNPPIRLPDVAEQPSRQ